MNTVYFFPEIKPAQQIGKKKQGFFNVVAEILSYKKLKINLTKITNYFCSKVTAGISW